MTDPTNPKQPSKNADLEARLAEANERLAAAEQRATQAEQALADRRTDEERYVDAGAAAVIRALERDLGWRRPDPDA
jgi:hypothetical protein